jgi:hypothetical protein
MKFAFFAYLSKLIGRTSLKGKPASMGKENIFELLNRLKKYDQATDSHKIDFLSIPLALQMVLRLFPHRYCNDRALKEKTLRSFVTTIIPEADKDEKFLIKMYEDEYYPFHTYCGYFIYDLNKRSMKLFSGKEFSFLSLGKRTQVVKNALSGRELTARLYKGAILMAQVSYYGAIYQEENGCKLIDFPGRNSGYETKEITYPFAKYVFCNELSLNGQPM